MTYQKLIGQLVEYRPYDSGLYVGKLVSVNNEQLHFKESVITKNDPRAVVYQIAPAYKGTHLISIDDIYSIERVEDNKYWDIRHHLRTVEDIIRYKAKEE